MPRKLLFAVLLTFVARAAPAQAPRLSALSTQPAVNIEPFLLTTRPQFDGLADSVHIRRTHWIEGGVVSGVIFGAMMAGLCYMEDSSPPAGCVIPVFAIGFVGGFPIGALIGGQFPKHEPAAAAPPPN